MATPSNNRNPNARKTGGKAGGRAGKPNKPIAGTRDKTPRVPQEWNARTVDPTNNRGGNQRPTGGRAGGRAGLPNGRIAGQSSSKPTPKPIAKPPTPTSTKPNPYLSGKPNPNAYMRGVKGASGVLRGASSIAGAALTAAAIPLEIKEMVDRQNRYNQEAKNRNSGVRTGTASGRTGRGGTTADARTSTAAKPRVSNIPPAEGTGRGGPSDMKRTQPKPLTRPSGGNPPAPGSIRRQAAPSSGGGGGVRGSSTPSRPVSTSSNRSSSPQTYSGTAGKGQQWADFNPNRGTSQTNNPLIKKDDWMMQRMKDREATQQSSDAQKLGNKFDTKSDLITPTTKVDGSNLDTKKIDQKKVDEYKRRKNRYYD